jgi:hypothetical protein
MNKITIFIGIVVLGGLVTWTIYRPVSSNQPSALVTTSVKPASSSLPIAASVPPSSPIVISAQNSQTYDPLAITTAPVPTDSPDNSNKSFAPRGTEMARLANTNPYKSYSPPGSDFARLASMHGTDNWNGAPKVPATGNWSGNMPDSARTYSPPGSYFAHLATMHGLDNWNGAPKIPATGNWTGTGSDSAQTYSPPGSNFAHLATMHGLDNWNGAPKVPATSNWSGNVVLPVTTSPSSTGQSQ